MQHLQVVKLNFDFPQFVYQSAFEQMEHHSEANEMNVMNHAPGAGSISQPVDQQSCVLPLSYGCPLLKHLENKYKIQQEPDVHSSLLPCGIKMCPKQAVTDMQQNVLSD